MHKPQKNMRFTNTHEWITTDTNDHNIGITEHAQELLGDMVFVELPKVGSMVRIGDELGVLESVKAASDFYAPISGEVVAVNTAVNENPALVNSDPYGLGWLVKIRSEAGEVLSHLLEHEDYQAIISGE